MNVDQRTHPLRLVVAGAQAFAYSWFVVAVLGVFAYIVAADSPVLGELTWRDAGSVATGWWLTSFGGSLHVNGVDISLPPLLITLATFGAALLFIRRLPLTDWKDILVLAVTGGVSVGIIGLLAPTGSVTWPAMIGAAGVMVVATLASSNRADWFSSDPFHTRTGRALYDATMLSRRALALLGILATIAFVAIVIINVSQIRVIHDFYVVSVIDRILLWAFQVAYLPTFLVWAAAFMTGAGFAVGAGTDFSALGVTAAPLPAVPIFGALPGPGGTYWPVLGLVVVVVFAYGWWQSSSFPTPREALFTGGIQIGVTGFVMAVVGAMSCGGIGPERMTVVGPAPPQMAGWSILAIGLPLVAGIVAGHRRSRQAYASWFSSATASASAHVKAAKERRAATKDREAGASGTEARAEQDAGAPTSSGDAADTGGASATSAVSAENGDGDVATAPTAPDVAAVSASSPEEAP